MSRDPHMKRDHAMTLNGIVLGLWLAGWLQFLGTLAPFAAAYLLLPLALLSLADFLPRRRVT